MKCLDAYRQQLVREINKEYQYILSKPEEDPVHDFRVGVKRLTALYLYLGSLNPEIKPKKILKPYRSLFKAIGNVRDHHIAENLCGELGADNNLIKKLKSVERSHYKTFKGKVKETGVRSIRVPSVGSFRIPDTKLLRGKKQFLENLITQISVLDKRMTRKTWHKKRILLKRYHHTLDAFQKCPGHETDEEELKQIRVLETLLGDWHDRFVTHNILSNYTTNGNSKVLNELKKQEKYLLDAARIYQKQFARSH